MDLLLDNLPSTAANIKNPPSIPLIQWIASPFESTEPRNLKIDQCLFIHNYLHSSTIDLSKDQFLRLNGSHPFTLFINDRLEEKRMNLLEQLYSIPIPEWRTGPSGTQKLPEMLLPQFIQSCFMTLQNESSFIMRLENVRFISLFAEQLSTAWFQPWFWKTLSHCWNENPMIYYLLNIVGFYGIRMNVKDQEWIHQWKLQSELKSLSMTESKEYQLYLLRAIFGLIHASRESMQIPTFLLPMDPLHVKSISWFLIKIVELHDWNILLSLLQTLIPSIYTFEQWFEWMPFCTWLGKQVVQHEEDYFFWKNNKILTLFSTQTEWQWMGLLIGMSIGAQNPLLIKRVRELIQNHATTSNDIKALTFLLCEWTAMDDDGFKELSGKAQLYLLQNMLPIILYQTEWLGHLYNGQDQPGKLSLQKAAKTIAILFKLTGDASSLNTLKDFCQKLHELYGSIEVFDSSLEKSLKSCLFTVIVMLAGYVKSSNLEAVSLAIECLRNLHFITLLFGLNGFSLWEGLMKRLMNHDIELKAHESPDKLCFDFYMCKQSSKQLKSETLGILIPILRSNWWSSPLKTREIMLKEMAHECFWSLMKDTELTNEKEEYSIGLMEYFPQSISVHLFKASCRQLMPHLNPQHAKLFVQRLITKSQHSTIQMDCMKTMIDLIETVNESILPWYLNQCQTLIMSMDLKIELIQYAYEKIAHPHGYDQYRIKQCTRWLNKLNFNSHL